MRSVRESQWKQRPEGNVAPTDALTV